MELCIKTWAKGMSGYSYTRVSILVLMELCIKTVIEKYVDNYEMQFQSLF